MKGPCDEQPVKWEQPDTETLLATVREALELANHANHRDWSTIEIEQKAGRAVLALDAIASELERMRAERDGYRRERDLSRGGQAYWNGERRLIQARLDRAVGALREIRAEIESPRYPHHLADLGLIDDLAARALAEIEESA